MKKNKAYTWILLAFCASFGVACGPHDADAYRIRGLDVSHYQKRIDWASVERDSFAFVFIKASEGQEYKDSLFQLNWKALESSRMRRGAYHFFRPTVAPEIQAQNFIEQVVLLPGDLPPVLDVEVEDAVEIEVIRSSMRRWLELVEAHYGIRPIVYTYMDFYHEHLQGQFEDYPLWLARYNRKQPVESPWLFWQYSNTGTVKGIPEEVDLNVFRGSLAGLDSLCLK